MPLTPVWALKLELSFKGYHKLAWCPNQGRRYQDDILALCRLVGRLARPGRGAGSQDALDTAFGAEPSLFAIYVQVETQVGVLPMLR